MLMSTHLPVLCMGSQNSLLRTLYAVIVCCMEWCNPGHVISHFPPMPSVKVINDCAKSSHQSLIDLFICLEVPWIWRGCMHIIFMFSHRILLCIYECEHDVPNSGQVPFKCTQKCRSCYIMPVSWLVIAIYEHLQVVGVVFARSHNICYAKLFLTLSHAIWVKWCNASISN